MNTPMATPIATPTASPRSPATWVLSLYFLQGLPFFMVNVVAGLMLKSLGIANEDIARWTGLLGLAWAIKPLWSPFLELARSKKRVVVATDSRRRSISRSGRRPFTAPCWAASRPGIG